MSGQRDTTGSIPAFGRRASLWSISLSSAPSWRDWPEVPWQATALAGAAVFALQDLGAYEVSPEARSWRIAIGMALIGAGQSLLAWSIGMGARLLVGS
jgi:hypothetical protein